MTDVNKTAAATNVPAAGTKPATAATAATTGAAPAPKAKADPKPKAEGEGRGRKSQYSGMRLFPTAEVNTRREGSHGHKSFGIILAAGKAGILYEDYIAKGGRLNDLSWDIDKDKVEARKVEAAKA